MAATNNANNKAPIHFGCVASRKKCGALFDMYLLEAIYA
jgi:hypothetical protein